MTRPLSFGLLTMSVEAAIPDRFWPAVRWACTYVFSWILPLMAAEEIVAGRLYSGGILSSLTLLDWYIAAKWESIERFVAEWRRPLGFSFIAAGVVLVAIGVALLVIKANSPAKAQTTYVPAADNTIPKEWALKTALHADFPGTFQTASDRSIPLDGQTTVVHVVSFRDPHNGAEFLGAYIPASPATFDIAHSIIALHPQLLSDLAPNPGAITIRAPGELGALNSSDNVRFTGRIFIYYDGALSLQQLASLDEFAKSIKVAVIFRDRTYLLTKRQAQGKS